MSTFDAEVSVLSATVKSPTAEALESGVPPHIEFGVIAGLALPVPDPQTGEALVIPLGRLRFKFEREQAIKIFEAALTAAKELPQTPETSGDVIVAQSMADVEAAAQAMKRVTGN